MIGAKPDFLLNLSPEDEQAAVRLILGEFKRTPSYAILLWWLGTLHSAAKDLYLAMDTAPQHRLLALGQEQVLERLLQHMDEVMESRPVPSTELGPQGDDFDMPLLPEE